MSSNPFEAAVILDGIRRWVEIESPTERPDQVNKLADLVASGYRDLSVSVDRVAGRDGCGDHLVTRSSWGQGVPGILVLSHLDTVHPMGFIERLPFKVEGNRAFGPGIYDMKGGAYLAYHAFRQVCADDVRPPLGVTQLYVSIARQSGWEAVLPHISMLPGAISCLIYFAPGLS
ncbi:acetylornithine deacetylase/succinyl-diaminopimelate desuccinylase-like protein [Bradyrhizobium elkanii]